MNSNSGKYKFSLKKQVLLYFIIITLLPICTIGVYYYYISMDLVRKNIVESHYMVLTSIMDNIDRQVEQASQLTNSIYFDNNMKELLNRSASDVNKFDNIKRQTIENLERTIQTTPVANHMLSWFIIGSNGLDIRNGIEAPLIESKELMKTKWFMEGINKKDTIFWGSISSNFTSISNHKYVIPQYRDIWDLSTGKFLGYSVVLFNESIFSNYYEEIFQGKGEKVYLIDSNGNIISTNQNNKLQQDIKDSILFKNIIDNEKQLYFEKEIDGAMNLIIYKKSSSTGFMLIEIVPMTQISEHKSLIERVTIVLIISVFAMCVVLSIFLSQYFVKPIQLLVAEVNEIAQGNFEQSISININNEIGELGKSVGKMKDEIKMLLQNSIDKEKTKRITEIRMLQSQINPHFVYNTLNSIKLMATLQGAQGIVKMIECLGRILRATLSDIHEKIPLREELNILEDYIHIQKIRYKGKMQVCTEIEDENILNCTVIKFILQPIIENTILHGIEPKDGTGKILISIYSKDDQLLITIWDDGVGMDETQIKSIQRSINKKDFISDKNGLGLNNINQRIKLVYGEEYGLNFESQLGVYTKVIIILPMELSDSIEQGDRIQ